MGVTPKRVTARARPRRCALARTPPRSFRGCATSNCPDLNITDDANVTAARRVHVRGLCGGDLGLRHVTLEKIRLKSNRARTDAISWRSNAQPWLNVYVAFVLRKLKFKISMEIPRLERFSGCRYIRCLIFSEPLS